MSAEAGGSQQGQGQGQNPAPLSPCIGVCMMDPKTGWCRGCLRTITEIACWYGADTAEKRAILGRVTERRHALPEARDKSP